MACWSITFVYIKLGIRVSYCLFRRNCFLTIAKKWGGISVFLMTLVPAFADQFDTVNYIANAGVNFDDNLFRLPNGADPQIFLGTASKSDLTRSVSLGINIDKKYSGQEVTLNAIGTNFKHSNFSSLDYTSSSFKGSWNWQISSRSSGTLYVTRAQSLNNPADTRIYTRNLNTADNIGFNGDWWVDSNWHLLLGVSNGQTTNSVNTINNLSSHNRTNEWGLKYDPADGKSITLISRNSRGTNSYPVSNQSDTGFTEKQTEFRAAWQMTGKSVLSGNLMKIDHHNFPFYQLDFAGNQGSLNYSLAISDKTMLNMSLQRSLNSWWDFYSNYYVADSVSISPRWQIGSKIAMHMAINRGINDYRGPGVPSEIARKDITQSVMLGVDWSPQRALTISAAVQHGKRSSTPEYFSGFGFDDNTASLSVQAYF